jgi:hypothetical protein
MCRVSDVIRCHYRQHLKGAALSIYEFASAASRGSGEFFASIDFVAQATGYYRGTVRLILATLCADGWLVELEARARRRGGWEIKRYRVVTHDEWAKQCSALCGEDLALDDPWASFRVANDAKSTVDNVSNGGKPTVAMVENPPLTMCPTVENPPLTMCPTVENPPLNGGKSTVDNMSSGLQVLQDKTLQASGRKKKALVSTEVSIKASAEVSADAPEGIQSGNGQWLAGGKCPECGTDNSGELEYAGRVRCRGCAWIYAVTHAAAPEPEIAAAAIAEVSN